MSRIQWTHDTATAFMVDAGWEPTEPFTISGNPWPSIHLACGELGSPRLGDVKRAVAAGRTYRCSGCAGKKPVTAEEAVEAMRAVHLEPLVPYPGMHARWECRCTKCERVVFPPLHNVRNHGTGCKGCDTDRRVEASRKDYGAVAIELLASKGLTPAGPYPGALAEWGVACQACGTVSHTDFNRIKNADWHCPNCKRIRIIESRKTLMASYGWTVIDVPEDLASQWTAAHSCGLTHHLRSGDVGRFGSGCPQCAAWGFDPSMDGWLYLLSLPAHSALKVGITNNFEARMVQHARNFDFTILGKWGPMPGTDVRRLERSVLQGWAPFNDVAPLRAIPGGTETVSVADVSASSAIESIAVLLDAPPKVPTVFVPSLHSVDVCDRSDAERMVVGGHYSHSLPKALETYGLFCGAELRGVAAFGAPSYPGVAESVWPEEADAVVELRRLFLLDEVGANAESWFLARTLKLLPEAVEVVVAFSDPSAGHHGGVYQATNFLYLGETKTSYHYESEGGRYVHKRLPWNWAKKAGTNERSAADDAGLRRVEDSPKHRYVYPLSRKARRQLTGRALPYPKPATSA